MSGPNKYEDSEHPGGSHHWSLVICHSLGEDERVCLLKSVFFPNGANKSFDVNKRQAVREQNVAKLTHVPVVYQERL